LQNFDVKDSGSIDIVEISKNIAKEKGISSEEVIDAMEFAIAKAGRTKYGFEQDIRAKIDRNNGKIGLFRYLEVVENIDELPEEERTNKINIKTLDKNNKHLKVGEHLVEELPPLDFGRIAVQTAKQVIYQRVKEAEKVMQYNEFKDKIGEIVNGVVKRVEYGNLIVDLGKGEAILRRDELLNKEVFRRSDRIRAYVADVKHDLKGHQIFLSRAHNNFLVQLFFQEVPEIYDGIIEVKSVARDPGSRAKIAVFTYELQGEKIDIVLWSEDIATYVVNALGPAEVDKVIIEEDIKKIDVIVPDEQLSLAIGRKGQNVRLASSLSGWSIDILTTSQESDRRNEEFKNLSQKFMLDLDVDEVIAHLLVTEGFSSLDEVAMVSMEELTSIEGFDDNLSNELITRAKSHLEKLKKENLEILKKAGVESYLLESKLISVDQLVVLNEKNIKTRDQLADLSNDELIEILVEIDKVKADEIIMDARKHWF